MDPDTLRARPPAKPKTTTTVLRDHEAEKRRQQRPVHATTTTARRVAVGTYESSGVDTPTTITVNLPSGVTWASVWVRFTDADEGALGAIAGPSDSQAVPAPYVDGCSINYTIPVRGATSLAVRARVTGESGDLVATAKATIYTF